MIDTADKPLERAALAMCERGIEIRCPWNSDLDDLERERFDALRAALTAALKVRWETRSGGYHAWLGPYLMGKAIKGSDGLWHAWLMDNDRGFICPGSTEDEAKSAVESAVLKAILGEES